MSPNKYIVAIVMSCSLLSTIVQAKLELLSLPATSSKLAAKSIVTSLQQDKDTIVAVGERGHIIHWQNDSQWQQDDVPVSVLLTDITTLSNGLSVAVGHDAAIVVAEKNATQWLKVFDGYQLTKLKISLLAKQIVALKQVIQSSEDEDELEEFEYQLDELNFSLEDAQAEQQSGPNKPLLSIAATANDVLFAVGAYGTLLRSDDFGKTWHLQDDLLDNPDKLHLNAITRINNSLYIAGESGTGFISDDEGDHWQAIDLPYSGSIFGIVGQKNTNNIVAFGLQGNVMTSNDQGQTWQHINIGTSASLLGGTVTATGEVFLVGHGGIVVHFNVNDVAAFEIKKHPSGSAFSSVIHRNDTNKTHNLVLAGQFGLVTWQFP